jgi:glycosyltransferase involved in cell wall biosynthesis
VAILEAMSSGLPVVSTYHSGIPETVVDGETGFLVEEGDVEGMSRAMERLVENPKQASVMGKKGRRRILKKFKLEQSIERLSNILLEAIR